jgi:hypothetical protein
VIRVAESLDRSRRVAGELSEDECRLGLFDEQGDRVVARGSAGRRLLVEDGHGASGGTPILSSPIAWRRRRRPVVLS